MSTHLHGQQNREHRSLNLFRSVIVVTAPIFFIASAVLWIFGNLGIIPGLRSGILSLIIIVLGTAFTIFIFIFQRLSFTPSRKEEQGHVPSPSSASQPQPTHVHPTQRSKDSYQDTLGVPPPTDVRTIQQREKVVQVVYSKLVSHDTTAIVLTGIAGVGKSTLAALVYRHAEAQRRTGRGIFTAQAIWLKIDSTSFTITTFATKLFEALGKNVPDFGGLAPREQASALFNALNKLGKARLVILDQFEALLDPQTGRVLAEHDGMEEWLNALNSQRCTCRVLLTSRAWPKVSREYTRTHIQEYLVRGLETDEGIELLQKQGIDATEAEMYMAVERCAGHAFALILLASILRRNRSLRLNDLFANPMYTQLWRGDIADGLLDYIYVNQLNHIQRNLLLAFSVYREAVPLEAALALMVGSLEAKQSRVVSALDGLLVQHLLEATGESRYQLHPIVADYAQDHFVEEEDLANRIALEDAHAKTAHYYIRQALQNALPHNQRKSIDDIHPIIEAIWQMCMAQRWQDAYNLMEQEKLFEDVKRLGGNSILLELYQLLLPLEKWSTDSSIAILVYTNLGRVCRTLGQKEQSRTYLESALQLCEQKGDSRARATVLSYLGRVYADLGQKVQALTYFDKALSLRKEIGDREGEAMTLDNLGRVYDELGQDTAAQKYGEEALKILREIRNRRGEGRTLSTLGRILNNLGQKEAARRYLEQSLKISREVGDRGGEGRTLHNLGVLYSDLGDKEQARDLYEQALSIRREISYRIGEGNTLQNLGQIYGDLGQKDKAMKYFNQALCVLREVGDQSGEGRTLYNLGLLYLKRLRYDIALACFLLAKNIFAEVQSPIGDETQKSIDSLEEKIGKHQYALLLEKVEPKAIWFVDLALQEGL